MTKRQEKIEDEDYDIVGAIDKGEPTSFILSHIVKKQKKMLDDDEENTPKEENKPVKENTFEKDQEGFLLQAGASGAEGDLKEGS